MRIPMTVNGTALTPALSRPTGEGEFSSDFFFAGRRESERVTLNCEKRKRAFAVPSPIGWERVRVRVR